MNMPIMQEANMTKDPVCGMEVDETKAIKLEYEGGAYYFHNQACMDAFRENPSKYVEDDVDDIDEDDEE